MLIDSSKSSLLIVDVQEKLFPKIHNNSLLNDYLDYLIDVFALLSLPIIYTEQYPKGLGLTIDSLKKKLSSLKSMTFEKTSFSCFPEKQGKKMAEKYLTTNQVIISGIETHICVLQTAIDLKNLGYNVFIINDAVGSRKEDDKRVGIQRALCLGINVISFEMLVFELLRDSNHKHFKELSKLIK